MPTLNLNFFGDLAGLSRNQLLEAGYQVPVEYDDDQVVYAWANVRLRTPPARARRVWRSTEFRCSTSRQSGLVRLEQRLERGERINSHLSRRLSLLDFHDQLLVDWGIQHLHLGITDLPNGLVAGTSELVYAIFEDDDVYFIQVIDHDAFCEPELLEIVHANWPSLLTRLALYGGTPPTADRVRAARNAHVVSPVTLKDGTVVAPRGGGRVLNGQSVRARSVVAKWRGLTEQWEGIVREEVDRVISTAQENGIPIPDQIDFVLWENESRWHAVAPALQGGLILPTS
jgi:hypothetical protein